MGKLPYLEFYPGDWLRDTIAGCSLDAQGLWLRMMIVAHDTERYGYLSINGLPMPPESIARRCGCTLEEYKTLFDELYSAGVPSFTSDKIIFSRRMVKDAEKRCLHAVRQNKYRNKVKDSANDTARDAESDAPVTGLSHEKSIPRARASSSSSSSKSKSK
jgi:hypothetical protein